MIPIIYPNGEPTPGKKYRFIKKMITPEELSNYNKLKKENQLTEPIKSEEINIKPDIGPKSGRIAALELWRRSPEQGSIYKEPVIKEDYDPVEHVSNITDTVGGVIRGGIASTWKKIKDMGKSKKQLEREAMSKESEEVMRNGYDSNY